MGFISCKNQFVYLFWNDYSTVAGYFQNTADIGSKSAMHNLCYCYKYRKIVNQDQLNQQNYMKKHHKLTNLVEH